MLRSKTDMLQELFGVQTSEEAEKIRDENFRKPPPPEMWVKMQLPYEASNHPGIPSIDEIEQKMEERTLRALGFLNVCRIGKCFVKRHNDRVLLQEAEHMLYLEANSQVRTPKVYAVFTRNGLHYLVMEFLEGEVLSDERWMGFSADARTKILSRLCEQLHLLRSIPSPGYYGRVHRQGWRPNCTLFRGTLDQMCGPYNNYRDMLSASMRSLEILAVIRYNNQEYFVDDIEDIARFGSTLATCSGLEPTFTHPDPALHNIIARSIRDGEDWEVTLIDWEDSGWLPAWMQAVAFQLNLVIRDKQGINREQTDHFVGKVLESFGGSYSEQLKISSEMFSTFGYTTM